jgi:hypothetical protein
MKVDDTNLLARVCTKGDELEASMLTRKEKITGKYRAILEPYLEAPLALKSEGNV